jgi:hypothetical protein
LESSGCRLVAVISENLTGRAKKGHKKVWVLLAAVQAEILPANLQSTSPERCIDTNLL